MANLIKEKIEELFELQRTITEAKFKLLKETEKEALTSVIQDMLSQRLTNEFKQYKSQIEVLLELLCRIETKEASNILLEVLNHKDTSLREFAGECLIEKANYELPTVKKAIKDFIKETTKGPGLREIPYILMEMDIESQELSKILIDLLKCPDPQVVAEGLEAISEIGDESCLEAVQKLLNDKRKVEIEDEPGVYLTIGELAKETEEEVKFLLKLKQEA
jgi:HEAT repeat protein